MAQGPSQALPGTAAGLHPNRAAGESLPLQPGVRVPLRPERRLPRPPLWPRAVEPSADLTTRARGLRRLRSFTPNLVRVWNYLDRTKCTRAEGGGGGAPLGHAPQSAAAKGVQGRST